MNKKKKSTALVRARRRPPHPLPTRRPKATLVVHRAPKTDPLATLTVLTQKLADLQEQRHGLTDEIALGALGLVELKLTVQEEAVLNQPVDVRQVRIKPTGQVYLSHPTYTRWFNRAFGRTGWTLVPAAKAMKSETSVVCPYVLYVHAKPVAFAIGEQEYFAGNRDQTYGDALESTVASALRRCAKRLGIGLELWDRAWTDALLQEIGVRVKCVGERDGKTYVSYKWRRRDDQPFWDEQETHRVPAPTATNTPEKPPVSHHSRLDEKINHSQVVRFWTLARKAGRRESEIKLWLATHGIESTKDILVRNYERVCAAVQEPGPLPGVREPGQEG